MRILFLSHAQYITVALPKIIEQAEVLSQLGHDVTLVATSKTNKWKIETFVKNGVHYVISPSILPGKFRHGADIYDAIRRSFYLTKNMDFDIIHAIDSRPSVILPALYLKKKKKIPLVLEWSDLYSGGGTISERSSKLYENTLGRIESFFETAFRKHADGATAITSFLKNKLIENGFDENKILIHRMGCLVSENKLFKKEKAREELKLSTSGITIGHLGKIYPKDHELLIESFNIIIQKNRDARLLFIGNVENNLKASNAGIDYLGFLDRDQFNLHCNAVDFFVLPLKKNITNMARWPSKVGDYFSFAKPVVSTAISDLEEIFLSNNLGLLANDNPNDFAVAMQKLINTQENWELIGGNAYMFAKNNLDWFHISKKLIDFYLTIIETKKN